MDKSAKRDDAKAIITNAVKDYPGLETLANTLADGNQDDLLDAISGVKERILVRLSSF